MTGKCSQRKEVKRQRTVSLRPRGHWPRAVGEVTGADSRGCVWEPERKPPSRDPPPRCFVPAGPVCGLEQRSSNTSPHTDHSAVLCVSAPLPQAAPCRPCPLRPSRGSGRTLRCKQESSSETLKNMDSGAAPCKGSPAIVPCDPDDEPLLSGTPHPWGGLHTLPPPG